MRWLAAGALVVLTACSSGAPAVGPTATAADTASPVPVGHERAVGLRDDAVVVVDPTTGEVTDEYPVEPGQGLAGLALVDARDVALVTRHTDKDTDELVEVSLEDGATRVLGEGSRPAVSGDGAHLAYVHHVPDTDRREVVAATYQMVEEHRWPLEPAQDEELEVLAMSWSPAAEELAVTLRSSAGVQVRILPVERDGTLRGASEELPPTAHGAEFVVGTFRGGRRVTVAEGCCDPGSHDSWRLLDVTLGTRETAELAEDIREPVTHLDWDPALTHLVVTLEGPAPTARSWTRAQGLEDLVDDLAWASW